MAKTFLKAEWRKLAMANYAVDKSILDKYLPYKTEIDFWSNTCYISLVGFLFRGTRIKGMKIPFHTNFQEVNLRFYVRFNDEGVWKRGVVFIKEIVPKPALTFVANSVYKENYETLPMEHVWSTSGDSITAEYKWKKKGWNLLKVIADGTPRQIVSDSEEEFITEHYWGYTRVGDRKTSEYEVEHPRWEVYPVKDYRIEVDFEEVYGKDFGFLKDVKPRSVFLAEGSLVEVKDGRMI